jgi:hypothetical protein
MLAVFGVRLSGEIGAFCMDEDSLEGVLIEALGEGGREGPTNAAGKA